jgi:alginate O-acetyltransferase complex protein AlgI
MVTLGVSGLWHGAAWHFVVWGLFHGAMLVIHRFYLKNIKPWMHISRIWRPITVPLAISVTFFGVVISRVFFILPLSQSWILLKGLFGL